MVKLTFHPGWNSFRLNGLCQFLGLDEFASDYYFLSPGFCVLCFVGAYFRFRRTQGALIRGVSCTVSFNLLYNSQCLVNSVLLSWQRIINTIPAEDKLPWLEWPKEFPTVAKNLYIIMVHYNACTCSFKFFKSKLNTNVFLLCLLN